MRLKKRFVAGFFGLLGGSLLAPRAHAAGSVVAFAAPGEGQGGVAVGFDAAGSLRMTPCAVKGCSIERGTEVTFPAELRPAIPNAQFSVVGIGEGRRAIVVSVTDARAAKSWSAVVVGGLGSAVPNLVFAGFTGFTAGEDGMRRGQRVEISPPDEGGARRIVIGDVQEDLSLCGRPALLAPQLLSSSDLKLHPAKVQRLSVEERDGARKANAVRVPAGETRAAGYGVLRALSATSAVGSPGALTDGNPETTWAENRGGAGRGEFVLLNAPPQLSISGLDLLIRPATAKVENGVAPRVFWLASTHALIEVTMPEDAWKFPGAHYRVQLEPPLQSDCLALVTESAFDENPKARVTFAELGALTEFDAASVPALVAALAGGGERAEAAASVLRTVGQPGYEAVAKGFDGLDEGGRRLALDVLDQAPCETSLPIFLKAFSGVSQAHAIHGRDHIRRCGKAAAPFLVAAAKTAKGSQQINLLGELLLADAAKCVDLIVSLLDVDSRSRRTSLRIALARASTVAEAKPRVLAVLADPTANERVTVEVLRALGTRISDFQPQAGAAIARFSSPNASFRTRFLLLAPSAELAAQDASLRAAYAQSLASDPDPRFRAQALGVVKDPAQFSTQIESALNDPDVRVREAAVRASSGLPSTVPALSERLAKDPWPLVRIAAADALAAAKGSPSAASALSRAIEDESPHVRAHVIVALGEHQVRSDLEKIQARLRDEEEYPMVRAAAAQALAALCDTSSLDTLTSYAQKLLDPMATAQDHLIGSTALLALGDMHPADLETRLKPLRAKGAPPQARQAADAVMQRRSGACGQPAAAKPAAKSRVPAS